MNANEPLENLRIIVTRPIVAESGPDRLVSRLSDAGATVNHSPLIETEALADSKRLDEILRRLGGFEAVVFVSPNGVQFFVERVLSLANSLDTLKQLSIGSIGPGTTQRLRQLGLQVSFQAQQNDSRGMAGAILAERPKGPILLVRGNRGSEVLNQKLTVEAVEFESVVVYNTRMVSSVPDDLLEEMASGKWHWITITSSEIARAAIELLGERLNRIKVVSLGPSISQVFSSAGFSVAKESTTQNFDGLVRAIIEFETNASGT